ncbi:MAG: hypothetical protein Q4C34_03485 [Bacteroidales bacterium]|nr:hypothetical protein [Bacteroidales bacterium]
MKKLDSLIYRLATLLLLCVASPSISAMEAPERLYIIGSIPEWNGQNSAWNPANSPEMTKIGNKFVIRNLFLKDGDNAYFQFGSDRNWDGRRFFASTKDMNILLAPGKFNEGGDENNFAVASGTYDITIDFDKEVVYAEKSADIPQTLYIVGSLNGGNWDPGKSVRLDRDGNKFSVKGVILNNTGSDKSYFKFITSDGDNAWGMPGCVAVSNDDDVTPGKVISFIYNSDNADGSNFMVNNGIYDITLDFDSKTISLANSDVKQLYIVGNLNGRGWDAANAMPMTKNGNVFTAKDIYFYEPGKERAQFQLLLDNNFGVDRYLPRWSDVEFDQNSKGSVQLFRLDSGGDNNLSIPAGRYDVTVNLNNGEVSVVRKSVPEHLYLRGNLQGTDWWESATIEMTRNGDKFTASNVILWAENDNAATAQFKFFTDNSWSASQYIPYYNDEITPDRPADFRLSRGEADNNVNFSAARGVYDVTFDYATGKVSLQRVDNYTDCNSNFRMSFWEGPVNEALRPDGQAGASDIEFEPYRVSGSRHYYRIKVADNIDPIKYVSQAWLGGYVNISKYHWDGDKCVKTAGASTDFKTYYFDARKTGTRVPVVTEYWCDNSRLEVGMQIKAIFLEVDDNKDFEGRSTPFTVIFSATGDLNENAPEQQPLNSDSYSLALSSGSLYEMLKGTAEGEIEIPFVRHNTAEEGYRINLGRDITIDGDQQFTLKVNGVASDKRFTLSAVNTLTPAGGNNVINSGLTFNQIILMVDPDDYSEYEMFLSDGDISKYPANYTMHNKYPMLKVWSGNDASWTSLYNSGITPTDVDGTVKYYEFKPVTKDGCNSNLYFLDLGEQGIKVKRAGYEASAEAGAEAKSYQFNIIDQNGYDISNPYQGSQYIYPGMWWCANPNLMDPAGQREYMGVKFRNVPELSSRVDLAVNLTPAQGDEITIYGITLFKIIGTVYDVYVEDVRENNVYYVYMHTQPVTGDNLRAKCEQSSPILVSVSKDAMIKEVDATPYNPLEGISEFNDPGFDDNAVYYQPRLSQKVIEGNADLNYLLSLIFKPGSANAIEFVGINGSQKWSATGNNDRLRSNKWSRYYTGDFDESRQLLIDEPYNEYYRVVLATNPDQVRYQIMSRDLSLNTRAWMQYSSVNGENYNPADKLIYPVGNVTTTLVWNNDYTADLTLEFVDADGKVVSTETRNYTSRPEGTTFDDVDAFYNTGESLIEINLGDFYFTPGLTPRVTVTYHKGNNDGETLTSERPMPLDYIDPVLTAISAEPATDASWNNAGHYTASLSWMTDNSDMPRHYEIHQYDLTGIDDKAGYEPEAERLFAITDENNGHIAHHSDIANADGNGVMVGTVNATITGATKLAGSTDIIDGKPTVTIGYRAHAVHHYAVPANGAIPYGAMQSFAELPDGFTAVDKTSHDSTFADRKYATALFNTDNTLTGIESVDIDTDNQPVEWFDLQGRPVAEPASGIYIRRQGNRIEKIQVK